MHRINKKPRQHKTVLKDVNHIYKIILRLSPNFKHLFTFDSLILVVAKGM